MVETMIALEPLYHMWLVSNYHGGIIDPWVLEGDIEVFRHMYPLHQKLNEKYHGCNGNEQYRKDLDELLADAFEKLNDDSNSFHRLQGHRKKKLIQWYPSKICEFENALSRLHERRSDKVKSPIASVRVPLRCSKFQLDVDVTVGEEYLLYIEVPDNDIEWTTRNRFVSVEWFVDDFAGSPMVRFKDSNRRSVVTINHLMPKSMAMEVIEERSLPSMKYHMNIIDTEPMDVPLRAEGREIKVRLEVGSKYEIYIEKPRNKKERCNNGRMVEYLGMNATSCGLCVVRYLDTGRRGSIGPNELKPVDLDVKSIPRIWGKD